MHAEAIEGYELSPQQRRLWLLERAASGDTPVEQTLRVSNTPYRAQCSILIEGKLDREALRRAIQKTVDRNEILRTRLLCVPELRLPLQVVIERRDCPFFRNEFDEPGGPVGNGRCDSSALQACEDLLLDMSRAPVDLEHG